MRKSRLARWASMVVISCCNFLFFRPGPNSAKDTSVEFPRLMVHKALLLAECQVQQLESAYFKQKKII